QRGGRRGRGAGELGRLAEHGAVLDLAARADPRAGVDDDVGAHAGAGPDADVGADDGVRPERDVAGELRALVDHPAILTSASTTRSPARPSPYTGGRSAGGS